MKTKNGFTLIELMVAIAVIGILAAILLPNVTGVVERANAAKMVAAANTLASGCEMFYMDTGNYAYEYAHPTAYKAETYHRLFFNPGYSGWKGPYIKSPLSTKDNPYNYVVYMYSSTNNWASDAGAEGFDFNGDGTVDTVNPGNLVVFYSVPSRVAERLNSIVDGERENTWQQEGKLEYRNNYYATFYLCGGR